MTMQRFRSRRLAFALAAVGLAALPLGDGTARAEPQAFDPLLSEPGRACGPVAGDQPALLKMLVAAAKTETTPFQPVPMQAAGGDVPLYRDLGRLHFKVTTARGSTRMSRTCNTSPAPSVNTLPATTTPASARPR